MGLFNKFKNKKDEAVKPSKTASKSQVPNEDWPKLVFVQAISFAGECGKTEAEKKSAMTAALTKLLPGYAGTENIETAISISHPNEVKFNVQKASTSTLLLSFVKLANIGSDKTGESSASYVKSDSPVVQFIGYIQSMIITTISERYSSKQEFWDESFNKESAQATHETTSPTGDVQSWDQLIINMAYQKMLGYGSDVNEQKLRINECIREIFPNYSGVEGISVHIITNDAKESRSLIDSANTPALLNLLAGLAIEANEATGYDPSSGAIASKKPDKNTEFIGMFQGYIISVLRGRYTSQQEFIDACK